MSLADLMHQTLTLHRTTSESQDEIGGVSVASETTLDVDAYVWASVGNEDEANRNTQLGTWHALIPAGTDVTGWDRASYDDRDFDIIAPPKPAWNPRTQTTSHIRLDLKEIE